MNVMWKQVKKERRPKAKNTAIRELRQPTIKPVLPSLTLTQCVEELLLIAIDSSPDCISIRVNVGEAFVQVIDNGRGINESAMHRVGERKLLTELSTNGGDKTRKPHSPWYGSGAEAVHAMIEVSEKVEVMSRCKSAANGTTFSKAFTGGLGAIEKMADERRCAGTTVTVHNLFYKTPVRKKQLNESKELNEVILLVQGLAVRLAGKISMSLRDEGKGKILINTSKMKTTKEAVLGVFGAGYCSSLHTLRGSCGDIEIRAVFSTEAYTGRKAKIITLNYKRIYNRRIEQSIDTQLKSSNIAVARHDRAEDDEDKAVSKPKHYFYCLDIQCDRSLYNMYNQDGKTSVEFYSWQSTLNAIYKIIKKLLIQHNVHKPEATAADRRNRSLSREERRSRSSKSTVEEDMVVSTANSGLRARKSVSKETANDSVDQVPTRDPPPSFPVRQQVDCGAVSRPSAADKPWPHVVYWLLKHVPEHIPRLDPLPPIEVAAPSNMSMFPHPGSVYHSSRLSDSLDSGSLTRKADDSDTVPHKRRRINTSFNEGDPSHTVFGSKLKIYKLNYETESHQRQSAHAAAAHSNPDIKLRRQKENIIPESAGHYLDRCRQQRKSKESRIRTEGRRQRSPNEPANDALFDFGVERGSRTPIRNSPRFTSHDSFNLFPPAMKEHKVSRRHGIPASPDVFSNVDLLSPRHSPLQPVLQRERYIATTGRGAHQRGLSTNIVSDVTFHGGVLGASEHVDIFCDEDVVSDEASVASGIPAIDRIFSESRSTDHRVSQRQSQRQSQCQSQGQSHNQSQRQRYINPEINRRADPLQSPFSPPSQFLPEFSNSPIQSGNRGFNLLEDNPGSSYYENNDNHNNDLFTDFFHSPSRSPTGVFFNQF